MSLAFGLLLFAHVLAACLSLGVDLAYAAMLWRASREPAHFGHALGTVALLDRRVAAPAFWALLATGLPLAWVARRSLAEPWLAASLLLFALAALAGRFGIGRPWSAMEEAHNAGRDAEFRRHGRRVAAWGVVLAALLVTILFLMVVKPGA